MAEQFERFAREGPPAQAADSLRAANERRQLAWNLRLRAERMEEVLVAARRNAR